MLRRIVIGLVMLIEITEITVLKKIAKNSSTVSLGRAGRQRAPSKISLSSFSLIAFLAALCFAKGHENIMRCTSRQLYLQRRMRLTEMVPRAAPFNSAATTSTSTAAPISLSFAPLAFAAWCCVSIWNIGAFYTHLPVPTYRPPTHPQDIQKLSQK